MSPCDFLDELLLLLLLLKPLPRVQNTASIHGNKCLEADLGRNLLMGAQVYVGDGSIVTVTHAVSSLRREVCSVEKSWRLYTGAIEFS